MKKSRNLLFAVLLVVLASSIVSARDYVCYILEDAQVYQTNPDTTFNRTWHETWDAPGYKRFAFFKFDFPRVSRNEEIESITFSIENYINGDHEDVDEHFIYFCSDNKWSEETITWRNAPLDDISDEPIGSHEMGKKGWVNFDITPLKDLAKPGTTTTIVLMQDNNLPARPYTAWYSREISYAVPYITVKTKTGKESSGTSAGNEGKIIGKIIEK